MHNTSSCPKVKNPRALPEGMTNKGLLIARTCSHIWGSKDPKFTFKISSQKIHTLASTLFSKYLYFSNTSIFYSCHCKSSLSSVYSDLLFPEATALKYTVLTHYRTQLQRSYTASHWPLSSSLQTLMFIQIDK